MGEIIYIADAVCPSSFIETEEWKLEDPEGKSLDEVRHIRDELKARITSLINN